MEEGEGLGMRLIQPRFHGFCAVSSQEALVRCTKSFTSVLSICISSKTLTYSHFEKQRNGFDLPYFDLVGDLNLQRIG